MNTRIKVLTSAEKLFDVSGFNGTGMDGLTRAAGVSSRTLYKHIGSKAELVAAVLERRSDRFRATLNVDTVDDLFAALERWMREEGARGCLFLRAAGEYGETVPDIAAAIHADKARLRDAITRLVVREIGDQPDISEQVLILFEGATAAAVYRGPDVAAAAGRAARTLMRQAEPR